MSEQSETQVNDSIIDIVEVLKKFDLDPKDPKILDKIVEHYKDIIGEKTSIKVTFLAAVSRKLPKNIRMHLNNYSTSGAGKSWVTRKVLKPFWHDVEEITKYTEAWFNSAVDDLEGKILLLQEVNKTDEQGKGSTGQMKILLSDEGISYRLMEMSEDGWIPKNKQSNALPVVITTTTKQLNEEDQRRFFILSADESTDQTVAILEHNMNKVSSVKLQKEIQDGYEQIKPLAGLYEDLAKGITGVIIPYAKCLVDILPKNLGMRTNSTKLIQLIQIVAFIHIMNRKMVVTAGNMENRYLLADIEDFNVAFEIAKEIFAYTSTGLSSGSLKLIQLIKDLAIKGQGVSYNVPWPRLQDCIFSSGLPRATFYSHLKPLIEKGYVEQKKIDGSKEHMLILTESAVDEFGEKELKFTDSDLDEWFKSEFDDSVRLINFSDDMHNRQLIHA